MVGMACCNCCEKTGACCTEEGCTQETCADCETAGGQFQGVDTECEGEDSDQCPCTPAADKSQCEKCVDGEPVSYCPESKPYCCDGVCQEAECVEGACCAPDGTCSQTTEGACEGVWQGADTLCEDYDCESGCCQDVTIAGCLLRVCRRGYDVNVCGPFDECDPSAPDPVGPVTDCDGGFQSSVTVTGAGYVGNTGDPGFDADMEDIFNASYVIDLACTGNGEDTFTPGDYIVFVNVSVTGRSAVISVFAFGQPQAAMTLSLSAPTFTTSECGHSTYDCGPFSGNVTSSSGFGDFSGASLNVA